MIVLLVSHVSAIEQGEESKFDFKKTLPILGDTLHTSCVLHSGYNLTMIHCAD